MSNKRAQFQGRVEADLAHIKENLKTITQAVVEIQGNQTVMLISLAKVKARVKVLWAAAGVLALAIFGLALRSF